MAGYTRSIARREFEKAFVATGEDSTPPDWHQWKIVTPAAGARDPVSFALGEPLDHALLVHFLRIKDTNGVTIGGEIELDATETVWRFRPREAWRPGDYSLQIDARLKSLAGNNLRGSFESAAQDHYTGTLSVVNRTFNIN